MKTTNKHIFQSNKVPKQESLLFSPPDTALNEKDGV